MVEESSRQLHIINKDKLWENSYVVAREKRLQVESFQQTDQSVSRRHFYKVFSLVMSSNFRYRPFVVVSGSHGWNFPIVDNVPSFHEQDVYPITSLDEKCIGFENQTDQNHYVILRQTYLDLKLKFVEVRAYETYNTKEVKSSAKTRPKLMTKQWRRSKRL